MKYKINNFKLNELKCTKEVLLCVNKVDTVSSLNKTDRVEPYHLCLSLILYSRSLQYILKINTQHLIRLKTQYSCTYENGNNYALSDKIIHVFNVLNSSLYTFNTVVLFYLLLKNDVLATKIISNIIDIREFNTSLAIMYNRRTHVVIPNKLREYLIILEQNNQNLVVGRNNEINHIISILAKKTNNNVILIGKKGIGKRTIIEKLSIHLPCKAFLMLDINSLLKIKDLTVIDSIFKYIRSLKNSVLYIKHMELLFNNSNLHENIIYFKNNLFSKLKTNQVQIISDVCNENEVWLDLIPNTFKFLISELSETTLISILHQYSKSLRLYYNKSKIILDYPLLSTVIKTGHKLLEEYAFPYKGLLILDYIYNSVSDKEEITENLIRRSVVNDNKELSFSNITEANEQKIQKIDRKLREYVLGQNTIIDQVMAVLQRSLAGIKDNNKPCGSFLLCGPSGTGKTELVKTLSNVLTNSNILRFDMSEFMEPHSVSKLIGCPPGYVGHEEGGLLTTAIRNKPNSIILFDEIEKAHPDINNIMLQLLDDGRLTDSKGETVDCTNTIIIFTSNLGCPTDPNSFDSFKKGIEVSDEEYKKLVTMVDSATKSFFRPEFLNRLDVLAVFKPLSIKCLEAVLDKFIKLIIFKLNQSNINITINIDKKTKQLLSKISYHPLYGARPLKRIVNQLIEKPISDFILNYKLYSSFVFSLYSSGKDDIYYEIQEAKSL